MLNATNLKMLLKEECCCKCRNLG
ncbi:hypothetical protein AB3S75_012343 [Citrus x aurantiifolia]